MYTVNGDVVFSHLRKLNQSMNSVEFPSLFLNNQKCKKKLLKDQVSGVLSVI